MPVKGQILISSDRTVAQKPIYREEKKRMMPIMSAVIDTTPDEV